MKRIMLILVMLVISVGRSFFAQEKMPSQDPATLKLSTEMVSLSVTVTDQKGKAIVGLKRENFKVYENGIEQSLSFFSTEEMPVSWALVLDRSGSMQDMIEDVYRAAIHVMDEGTEEDETAVITFNKKVELVTNFTSDKHRLQNSVLGLRAVGDTSLWDAIRFTLDHLKQAKHRKKVLVVITDGEDNTSHTAFRDLVKQAEEAGVLIYTVGMFEAAGMSRFGARSRGLPREELTKLAEITGASAHFPTNVRECQEAMQTIAGEVGHQYSVGYYPNDTKNDSKWRKLQVVVSQNEGKVKYVARTRAGYYAPKNDGLK